MSDAPKPETPEEEALVAHAKAEERERIIGRLKWRLDGVTFPGANGDFARSILDGLIKLLRRNEL
jgi:hypothetical protein